MLLKSYPILQERVEQELFPLTGTTHYRVSVASLSTLPGDDDHADDITGHQVYNVVTGKFGIYSKYIVMSLNTFIREVIRKFAEKCH